MLFAQIICIRHRYYREIETPKTLIKADDSKYFTQRLDHFDNTNQQTFQQKFLVNETWYDKKGGVAILQVGGEGPIQQSDVGNLWSADQFSESMKALNVELEHRYYGESIPQPLNYTFLSSRQALADLTEFAAYLKKTYGVTKIITYGGSYPGNLAGWARSRFPFVFDAAIASSGPLMGRTKFSEYFQHDEMVLESIQTGCKDKVKTAMEQIEDLLLNDKKQAAILLKNEKLATQELTELDISNIISLLSNFAGMIQYASESQQELKDFCAIMMKSTDLKTDYVAWNFEYSGSDDLGPMFYNEMVEDTKLSSWTWQTCTEFGYFQDSDFFTSRISMDYYYHLCLDAFEPYFTQAGIKTTTELKEFMAQVVDGEMNAFYGARNQPRSKIFYTNGKTDPWSELSMNPEFTWADGQYLPDDSVQRLIPGSHCSDMRTKWSSNKVVRAEQLRKLKEWINYQE
ncbi:Serine_carboxypeptidase [Hexamita inflata]|uniref:Serine carboxypeptidase n=1 Tax=Hexamita inflata TaxID=28002 RepID=A0AA86NTR5_9EUKA|nr:Serine carboxypeptidase [Hexamita inflata]